MKKQMCWHDIPSLEGMEVDWDYKPPSLLGKRTVVRLQQDEISALFERREILVKIASAQKTYSGRLLDLSENGLSVGLSDPLPQGLTIRVGFFLGAMKINTKAEVVHARKKEAQYTMGLRFIDLNPKMATFIGGLYAAKVLHQIHRSG